MTRQFRRGGGPVLGSRPVDDAVVHVRERTRELRDLQRGARTTSTFRDELIALGLDPRTGTGAGHALGDQPRRRPEHDQQPARREARLRRVACTSSRRASGWRAATTTTRSRSRGATTARSAARRGRRAGAGRLDRRVRRPGHGRAVLQALLPRRRHEPARLGTLRSLAAERRAACRSAAQSFVNFSTELRAPVWGSLGAVLFLDGGNVWTNPGTSSERSALRRRARACATRRRSARSAPTSATSSTRFPACW